MTSTLEVEMLRRRLDELTAQMIEMRQQSSSTAMNAAVSGLAEAVRTMGQSVSKPRPEDMSRKVCGEGEDVVGVHALLSGVVQGFP